MKKPIASTLIVVTLGLSLSACVVAPPYPRAAAPAWPSGRRCRRHRRASKSSRRRRAGTISGFPATGSGKRIGIAGSTAAGKRAASASTGFRIAGSTTNAANGGRTAATGGGIERPRAGRRAALQAVGSAAAFPFRRAEDDNASHARRFPPCAFPSRTAAAALRRAAAHAKPRCPPCSKSPSGASSSPPSSPT